MASNYRGAYLLFACGALSGCGLAGTASSTAAGAASEAQEARAGQKTEQQVQQQLDEAQRTGAAQREAAEKDAR